MNIDLSDEAAEYGRQALRAFQAAGGDDLVRQAEAEPGRRASLVGPVLDEMGALGLDPRGDARELEAAAAVCRAAGRFAVPFPVAERLCRPAGPDAGGLLVVDGARPAGAVAGLDLRWAAVTLDGLRGGAVVRSPEAPPRTSAFVTELDLRPVRGDGAPDLALGLVLPCWTLLGMLDRAIDLTREHVLVREQFGQALARFQGVRFQLTEAEVERSGVEVLAKYALWSVQDGRDEAVDDALALRLAAVEAADVVFRVAHQLHGAIGFCDEAFLSWLSRYSQPLRRLPLGLSGTRDRLTRRLGRRGLTGPYGEAPVDRAPVDRAPERAAR
ncbi:acyl-CoA dehydrogenase [Actinomadura darangshiensis]|uniref:Acyl-CoA dehydrogenase n=1 Tax=Actinomadura darangshiensis TaxID=705336 RepID=A0A4R5C1U4_9ACTN|nr:acyl-CoA dehydrogenase family protein [Actinomadura darangshiensis]TDD91780.1 acyl-CoA dehydrogenase [Actinomadura darangshiensis]